MSNKSGTSVINTPSGGGAQQGLGEKFSPDLFTGTGNFSVPIALPPGRNGFQPETTLSYSTGNGNSSFGLGWGISIPGVMRKIAKGVPRYDDDKDTFILSGAEDLIAMEKLPGGITQYRPRTEGLFARIYRHLDANNDYWKVMTKDGLTSWYATPGKKGQDDAVVADPDDSNKVFQWKLTKTQDPFGNVIIYSYAKENLTDAYHRWEQSYLSNIQYMDYGDKANPKFLMKVVLEYEERPDPFSEYKMGFETRINKRCKSIKTYVQHNPDTQLPIHTRTYHFQYLDEMAPASELPLNGVSLLSRVEVEGHDGPLSEKLPPLDFRYTQYQPGKQKFSRVKGRGLPTVSLGTPTYELASLFGNGLPDIVEINGTIRYWRNLGNGEFDMPRLMKEGPGGLNLGDAGVQLIDADGDGRVDLMVHRPNISGYFPSRFGASWDQKSFQKYKYAPSFNLQDPNVKLVDLDGDGITDAIRSGSSFECFFNDQYEGWNASKRVPRQRLERFPDVNFSDPRIKWADMTGDGLQSILYVSSGKVQYWPAMGYGNFGKPVIMKDCPRFPYNYDPRRILIGDVDGDGIADLVYVDYNKVTVWINKSGNGWSAPVEITGTPAVADPDGIRLEDLYGIGTAGILWTTDLPAKGGANMYFLDLTGGVKPYLLSEMENNMGSLTRVKYESSIVHYLRDQQKPATRWKTHLPFPVQVVSRVEVLDQISLGKLATEYLYHHGYWDGGEREFRGFARVDQRDTETFADFNDKGLHPDANPNQVTFDHYAPPIETRNWFHMGPVGDEFGDWYELDLSHEQWQEDPQVLERPDEVKKLIKSLPRRAKRDAIRCWRGSMLRSELYALDSNAPDNRPYTVTESQTSIRLEYAHTATLPGRQGKAPAKGTSGYIFFSFGFGSRTTQWERGNDPMTQLSFTGDFDNYGQPRRQMAIAVPRLTNDLNPNGRKKYTETDHNAPEKYFITAGTTDYIHVDTADQYMTTRVCSSISYEVINDGKDDAFTLHRRVMGATLPVLTDSIEYKILGRSLTFYDGPAFTGLPYGQIGKYGVAVRAEALVATDVNLVDAYGIADMPECFKPSPDWAGAGAPAGFVASLQNGDETLGYTRFDALPYTKGWYAKSSSARFDFHTDPFTARGLAQEMKDPFDAVSTVAYDAYGFLPTESTVIIGVGNELTTAAEYDYRTLQANLITDPNGNRAAFKFTPLGLLNEKGIMGKVGEVVGDIISESPFVFEPSVRIEYDFFAWKNQRLPVWAKTIQRIHHINDGVNNEIIEAIEYSDGFGRLLQTRSLAEDVIFGDPVFGSSGLPADQTMNGNAVGVQRGLNSPVNVRVSGWTIYDNKGRAVEQYEPFFDKGFAYRAPGSGGPVGEKVRMFYDPRGQVVRTVNPNGSEQQVIFGVPKLLETPDDFTPTPWESYTYDANDLAGITHPTESQSYIGHWWTPSNVLVDAMGRAVKATTRLDGGDEVTMRSEYDIRGNVLSIRDAFDRPVFRHRYDLANQTLWTEHIDSGVKQVVYDATGKPMYLYDSLGHTIYNNFDAVGRARKTYSGDRVVAYTIYGDDTGVLVDPAAVNMKGQPYKQFDEAGYNTVPALDFKGQIPQKIRAAFSGTFLSGFIAGLGADISNHVLYAVDWTDDPETVAAGITFDEYVTNMEYDALGRPKSATVPQTYDLSARKTMVPIYNRAGALESMEFDGTQYIKHIAYNAKGQSLLAAYDNGTMTRQVYDPKTFRPIRAKTEKYTASGNTYTPVSGSSNTRQDNAYEYDLVGNILKMKDRTPDSGIDNTILGIDALDRMFKYDPLYRLLEATGREANNTPAASGYDDPGKYINPPTVGGTPNAYQTRAYKQRYEYDKMGRMVKTVQTGVNGWTRNYSYINGKNRLDEVRDGSNSLLSGFTWDLNGNLTGNNSERHYRYDHADRMTAYYNKPGGGNATKYAAYFYDGSGARTTKFIWTPGTGWECVTYIDGMFEYHHNHTTSTDEYKNYIQLDGGIEIRVGAYSDDTEPAVIYSGSDHLSSVSFRLDEDGDIIDREEYYPYGETSLRTFERKRYRYTGKEKDGESGLYYYGARYYVPWLASFTSTDPAAGSTFYQSPYNYADCNPIVMNDPTGMQSEPQASNKPTEGDNITGGREITLVKLEKGVMGHMKSSGKEVWLPEGTIIKVIVHGVEYNRMHSAKEGDQNKFVGWRSSNGIWFQPATPATAGATVGDNISTSSGASDDSGPSGNGVEQDTSAPTAPAPPAAEPAAPQSTGEKGIGQPGFAESLIPVWGSARAAIDDFQNGRWGWGIFNTVMAVTDLVGVGALAKVGFKAIVKGGIVAFGKKQLKETAIEETTEKLAKNSLDDARKLGKAGEDAAGVVAENKQQIESLTGSAKYRIPDVLTPSTIEEVKNVARQHLSRQLKDYILYAQKTGRQFILHTRRSTKLSKPLQDLVDQGVVVPKYID